MPPHREVSPAGQELPGTWDRGSGLISPWANDDPQFINLSVSMGGITFAIIASFFEGMGRERSKIQATKSKPTPREKEVPPNGPDYGTLSLFPAGRFYGI